MDRIMKDPLLVLAATFDEAHALTHVATVHPDETPVPVYQDGRDTGDAADRVRFRCVPPSGTAARRLHDLRQMQSHAFEALADALLAGAT